MSVLSRDGKKANSNVRISSGPSLSQHGEREGGGKEEKATKIDKVWGKENNISSWKVGACK